MQLNSLQILPHLYHLWLCLSPSTLSFCKDPCLLPVPPLPLHCPSLFPLLLFKGEIPSLSPWGRLQGFLEGTLQFLSRLDVLPPSPVQAHCSPCSDLRRTVELLARTQGWKDMASCKREPRQGEPQSLGAAGSLVALILPFLIPTAPKQAGSHSSLALPEGCVGCQ